MNNLWTACKTGVAIGCFAMLGACAQAQLPVPAPQASADKATCAGAYKGVDILPDNRVIFRICAPKAEAVTVYYDSGTSPAFSKDATGMFSGTTVAPLAAHAYRYYFNVDGLRVVDPHATQFSEYREGVAGVFEVDGPAGDFLTYNKDVPHGTVSIVEYWSKSLDAKRRIHVYTPPGYENDHVRYPVLYLFHGTGDNDTSWSTIGRANLTLDNLIAAGRAKPMILVMTAGHTPPRGPNATAPVAAAPDNTPTDDFGPDFLGDLMPLIKARYRTIENADHRAVAGQSKGGGEAQQYGLFHPELFHYVGMFGIGIRDSAAFERDYGKNLDEAARKTTLVYYGLGREDQFFHDPAPMVDLFAKHGIKTILNYTGGGHTWMNWQDYLYDFAPRLFK